MNKSFQIKKYSLTGTFIETVDISAVISDLSFSSSINAGQGDCDLEMNLSIGNTDFELSQFLEIYIYSDTLVDEYTLVSRVLEDGVTLRYLEDGSTVRGLETGILIAGPSIGKLIYSGMITKITGNITNGKETLTLNLLGLGSLLTFIYLKTGGSYAFNLNQEPATTIKAVIDYFNTVYTGSWLNYSSNVVNYGSSINQAFSYNTCLDSIKNTTNGTNYRWHIRSTGELYFKGKPTTATHILTIGKDIDNLTIEQDSEKITNKSIIFYNGGDTNQSDGTSQTSFGLRELKEDRTSLLDLASANIYASNFITKNKDYKKKTSIIVNNSYNIEGIEIGDTVTVVNTDLVLINLQIVKLNYSIDRMQIELETFDSFAKEIIG